MCKDINVNKTLFRGYFLFGFGFFSVLSMVHRKTDLRQKQKRDGSAAEEAYIFSQ